MHRPRLNNLSTDTNPFPNDNLSPILPGARYIVTDNTYFALVITFARSPSQGSSVDNDYCLTAVFK